jgi:hypothetical protein
MKANVKELRRLLKSRQKFLWDIDRPKDAIVTPYHDFVSEGVVEEISPSGKRVKIRGYWYHIDRVTIIEEL